MAVSAPKSSAAASFLERRESERALHFVKYQGLGNDFIMVGNRDSAVPKVTPEAAVKLCDRNFGIGADGVIFVMPGVNGADYTMRIFNSDGSEPEVLHVDDLKLSDIGPKFEHHEMFPARTNTEFVQVLSRSHLKMQVWERGAGATLACGTGACAVVLQLFLRAELNGSV